MPNPNEREKKILEQRARAWEQMKDITDKAKAEERDWTPEERSAWDQADAEIRDCDARLEDVRREQRFGEMDELEQRTAAENRSSIVENENGETRVASRPTDTKEYAQAFRSWLAFGMEGTSVEERALLSRQFGQFESRAQGVASGSAGGYFVPQGFRAQVIETQKFYSNLRPIADTITTDTGNPLPWPTNDDTSNVGAILAENTTISAQDVVLGTAQLGAYTYTSKLVAVSLQLLQDSAIDIDSFVARKLGQRLGRIQNQHFTTGTGSSQPQGVVTGVTTAITGATGQTLTVTYDNLVDLVHSIDPAYRQGGQPRWMFHDKSLAVVRKLKDSQNRPLWQPALTAGAPDMLFGYPYTVNNDMAQMGANAVSVLFGDFNAYYIIRDVLAIQMVRLTERYMDNLQVGFFAFQRTDAKVQDANAVKAYANSAT